MVSVKLGDDCYDYWENLLYGVFIKKNHSLPKNHTLAIEINGLRLEKVTKTQFLDVTIDEQLNWHAHVTKLTKKLDSCPGMLNR